MKIRYDPETDILTVELRSGTVAESDEERPGIILDYDAQGEVLGIEILDASQRVEDPRTIEFRAAS